MTSLREKKNDEKKHRRDDGIEIVEIIKNYPSKGKWISPMDANKRKRLKEEEENGFYKNHNPEEPFTSYEFGRSSSVISLDYGLVSPSRKKNWFSPPQRIERALNREWSPGRVIDRPNPENSPGNWISIKESCQQQSPPMAAGCFTLRTEPKTIS
ncbi:hypothetical protein Phum_PHUM562880 [Pediculus humanus corporis]|uniref:Uncharacterized protein n=1 Tax=Pediculus humanus subsp. corporis TaxID=121224 RepID=E0W0S6_PEDHC|nr:uncharacterized protein Phum_PHUM562880 [Pediculus humanus corporis]EEB19232.1 hypothetical protein Phum_PHUM562880 [Pediculus humanus corporis]